MIHCFRTRENESQQTMIININNNKRYLFSLLFEILVSKSIRAFKTVLYKRFYKTSRHIFFYLK